MLIIPWQDLKQETLLAVLEEYISREGTDYGMEYSMEQKREHLLQQLRSKQICLCYDNAEDSVNMLTAEAAKQYGLE